MIYVLFYKNYARTNTGNYIHRKKHIFTHSQFNEKINISVDKKSRVWAYCSKLLYLYSVFWIGNNNLSIVFFCYRLLER